jgi:hypothetical protein
MIITYLIVSNRPKERLVQKMPCNIFNNSGVPGKNGFGINHLKVKGLLIPKGSEVNFATDIPTQRGPE